MKARYITAVSGMGRCGSSMVMQMLYCGGMPIDLNKAPWPYVEDARQTTELANQEWVREYYGSALKWLEPTTFLPPMLPFLTIWLDRDPKQQAKSHVKFNMARGRSDVRRQMNSQSWRRFMEGKKARRPVALKVWRRRGPLLCLEYEQIKSKPLLASKAIAEFLGRDLNVEAMATAVRDKETKCRPDMLEVQLRAEGPPKLL